MVTYKIKMTARDYFALIAIIILLTVKFVSVLSVKYNVMVPLLTFD